jgi:hypothetical protein
VRRLRGVAVADEDETGAELFNLLLVRAELRGLLRAVESAEVAEEDEDGRAILERLAERDHGAARVEDGQLRELLVGHLR